MQQPSEQADIVLSPKNASQDQHNVVSEETSRDARINETIAQVAAGIVGSTPPDQHTQAAAGIVGSTPPDQRTQAAILVATSFACARCDGTFTTRRALRRHERRNNCVWRKEGAFALAQKNARKSLAQATSQLAPYAPEYAQFLSVQSRTCNGCGLTFATRRTLRRHVLTLSCDWRERALAASRSLACDRCGLRFASKSQQRQHLQRGDCEPLLRAAQISTQPEEQEWQCGNGEVETYFVREEVCDS